MLTSINDIIYDDKWFTNECFDDYKYCVKPKIIERYGDLKEKIKKNIEENTCKNFKDVV